MRCKRGGAHLCYLRVRHQPQLRPAHVPGTAPAARRNRGGNGLRPHGIAAVALSPGWICTELALHAFKANEGDWGQVEALRRAESTPYVGRAVVAPARNGRMMRKSGRTLVVGELACVYGLTVGPRPVEPPPFRVPPTAHG